MRSRCVPRPFTRVGRGLGTRLTSMTLSSLFLLYALGRINSALFGQLLWYKEFIYMYTYQWNAPLPLERHTSPHLDPGGVGWRISLIHELLSQKQSARMSCGHVRVCLGDYDARVSRSRVCVCVCVCVCVADLVGWILHAFPWDIYGRLVMLAKRNCSFEKYPFQYLEVSHLFIYQLAYAKYTHLRFYGMTSQR